MGMNQVRTVVAAAGVGCLLLVGVPSSEAATAGVGSSGGGTEALHIEIGDGALDLHLLNELSSTNNDALVATPEALERLAPLSVASSLLPALSSLSVPAVESRSTGAENTVDAPTIDLGSLGGPVPGLLDGTISATLRSLVDADGALAALTGAADGVSVLGGVLRLGSLDANLGSLAATEQSGGDRSLSLDSVEVLDLAAVLQLLGIDVTDLPLDVVAGLLDALGVALPFDLSPSALVGQINTMLDDAQAQAGNVFAQVATLQAQLDAARNSIPGLTTAVTQAQAAADAQTPALQSQLDGLQGQLDGLVCAVVPQLCADLNAQIATVTDQITALTTAVTSAEDALAAANALINQLVDQIQGLLSGLADLVDPILDLVAPLLDDLLSTTLLTVNDLNVGVVAQARDSVANSVADVTGSIGSISIGDVTVPGLDALGTVDQVVALSDQITGALGGILAIIDPSLANLVDIDVLDRSTSIVANGAATEALASLTGLRVTITPPDLCGLLTRLGATPVTETLGGLLDSLGGVIPPLPVVGNVLGDLGSVLNCNAAATAAGARVGADLVGGLANALTQPLTVEALTVGSQGAFTPAAAQVPTTTTTPGGPTTTTPGPTTTVVPGTGGPLPRTGGGELLVGAAGLGLLATAVWMRRLAVLAGR